MQVLETQQKTTECLIPNGGTCHHSACRHARRLPQYDIRLNDLLKERPEITHFKIHTNARTGQKWLLFVNPFRSTGDKEKESRYEIFRQANEIECYGEWPANREVFHISEMKVEFREYISWTNAINNKGELEKVQYTSVKEIALFQGS